MRSNANLVTKLGTRPRRRRWCQLSKVRCSCCLRAHRACVGGLGLARQQCNYRSCTASANQLQLQRTTKTRSPVVPPSARPLCPLPRRPKRQSPQRAAPCTVHRSHKTSRDTHHTCAVTALAIRPERWPAATLLPQKCTPHAGLRGRRRAPLFGARRRGASLLRVNHRTAKKRI